MLSENFVQRNPDIYNPAYQQEVAQNLYTEKLKRIDKVDKSIDNFFNQIEEIAAKNLDEARQMTEATLLQVSYFYKIAGLEQNEIQNRVSQVKKLFDAYFASLEVAIKVFNQKMEEARALDKKISEAQTPQEMNFNRSLKQQILKYKEITYQHMIEQVSIAKQRIKNLFEGYYPPPPQENTALSRSAVAKISNIA